jgi:pimeloyl-ACP methyl ester carboxylesterase
MSHHGGLTALRVSDGFLRFIDLAGDGPPVVWIHGWQCSSTGELLPAAVQQPLAGRRPLLVDLLGHGYSDKPHDFSYTLVEHARTIVELIDGLGIGRLALEPASGPRPGSSRHRILTQVSGGHVEVIS